MTLTKQRCNYFRRTCVKDEYFLTLVNKTGGNLRSEKADLELELDPNDTDNPLRIEPNNIRQMW